MNLLPIEALSNILLHLSHDNLMMLKTTKKLYNVIITNEYFWKEKLLHDFLFESNEHYYLAYIMLFKSFNYHDDIPINIDNIDNTYWNNLWNFKINKQFGTTFVLTDQDLLAFLSRYTLPDIVVNWSLLYNYMIDVIDHFVKKIVRVTKNNDTYASITIKNSGYAKNYNLNKCLDFSLLSTRWDYDKHIIDTLVFDFKQQDVMKYVIIDFENNINFTHTMHVTQEKQKDILYKMFFYCHNVEVLDNKANDILLRHWS